MRRWLAVLAAAGLAASVAYAADETISGQRWVPSRNRGPAGEPLIGTVQADTTAKDVAVTTTGGLVVSDEDRDRDNLLDQQIFTNSQINFGAFDSSAVLDVHDYSHLSLSVNAFALDSLGSKKMFLAISFMECHSGLADSLNRGIILQRAAGSAGTIVGDTTSVGDLIAASATAAGSGEVTVYVTPYPAYGIPRTKTIHLDEAFGGQFRARYLQIKIRNISPTPSRIRVNAWLNGWSN